MTSQSKHTASNIESSARAVAVEQLNRIEVGEAYINALPSEEQLAPREERQVREYVAGVTRWRRWLDFVLADFYRGNYDKMEPLLRQILRLGSYELLFLRTPPHAALNEAVEGAKRKVRPGAAGLVNGMLRNMQRQQEALPEPDTGDPAEDLAIRHSHPTWMVRRWLNRYDRADTDALLKWNNARPTYGLRVNTLKTDADAVRHLLDEEGVVWEASSYLDDFVRLRRLQTVVRAGWLAEGRCAVQDESAGLVVRLLDPQPGETVIDGCAAPGGKSLYAAARMDNEGCLQAVDVSESRLRRVREGARQGGARIVRTEAADLRALANRSDTPRADRVLVDVPCSGLGVLSKRADLRWRRRPEDLGEQADLQAELLKAASRLLRPGGVLVYSTCTIAPEENEQVVEAFLDARDGFALETAGAFVPSEVVTPAGYYATLPFRHRVDGAFGARLRHRPRG